MNRLITIIAVHCLTAWAANASSNQIALIPADGWRTIHTTAAKHYTRYFCVNASASPTQLTMVHFSITHIDTKGEKTTSKRYAPLGPSGGLTCLPLKANHAHVTQVATMGGDVTLSAGWTRCAHKDFSSSEPNVCGQNPAVWPKMPVSGGQFKDN